MRTRFEFSIVALENTPHPVMNREASSSKRMICSCVCSNQSACPEAVGVPAFVAYPFASSLLMWFIVHELLCFEDPMDPVMAYMCALFIEDFL